MKNFVEMSMLFYYIVIEGFCIVSGMKVFGL